MIPLFIVAGVIVLDQLTKILIRSNFGLGETMPIVGDYARLTFIRNTGTAFSMFENNHLITIGLTTVLIVVCLFFIIGEWKRGSKLTAACASFVFAGGISNLIDRIVLGYVTDMISIGNFAIFNVADIAVTCGCVCTAIVIIFATMEDSNER